MRNKDQIRVKKKSKQEFIRHKKESKMGVENQEIGENNSN